MDGDEGLQFPVAGPLAYVTPTADEFGKDPEGTTGSKNRSKSVRVIVGVVVGVVLALLLLFLLLYFLVWKKKDEEEDGSDGSGGGGNGNETLDPNDPNKIVVTENDFPGLLDRIALAVRRANSGLETEIVATYSWVLPNTAVSSTSVRTIEFQDSASTAGSYVISKSDFHSQIEAALSQWKSLIESAYPKIEFTFRKLGNEKSGAESVPISSLYPVSTAQQLNIGDFRFGFYAFSQDIADSADVLGYSYPPTKDMTVMSFESDVLLNAEINWRKDTQPPVSGEDEFSVEYVVAHEAGHALGLGHATDPSSLMFAFASPETSMYSSLPNGELKDSTADRAFLKASWNSIAASSMKRGTTKEEKGFNEEGSKLCKENGCTRHRDEHDHHHHGSSFVINGFHFSSIPIRPQFNAA